MIRFTGISIGDIILLLTAIVVIWYSWETKGMRKEMVNQNEKLGKTLKLQTFSEYTKRYQEIILNLPENINEAQFDYGKLNDETRQKNHALYESIFRPKLRGILVIYLFQSILK